MPKAIVEFAIEVAVGIDSYALMQITEDYKETHGFTPDGACRCVKDDIEQLGFQDWVKNNLDDVPAVNGMYVFNGTAEFDDDSADYSATCINI